MARGTQFLDIVTRVKNDSGRSNAVNVGTDDLPRIKEAVNTVYQILYMQKDWRHLRKRWSLPLAAGQRYYDFPTGLNPERLEYVKSWWSEIAHDIGSGITDDDYSVYDSDAGARAEPVQKWDVVFTGVHDQIEIWPIPSTNTQEIRFKGIQAAPRLINDIDICLLDDTLIVLGTSAYLEKDKEEREKKDAATSRHMATLHGRNSAGMEPGRVGLGHIDQRSKYEVVLRVR